MNTFLEAYKTYTDKAEPPRNFQVWTAMSTISALLGRKCFIPQGFFTVYPNLYVVLVGPAGAKKSTAMNIGKKILRSLDGFPLAPESVTREALMDTMAENKIEYELMGKQLAYHQCSAFASELSEFIGEKHVNSATISFLTNVWDEDSFKAKTRHSGSPTINCPYFSMIACCTPDWMTQKLKDDIITNGFARRTIFVYERERHCLNPWPETTPATQAAWETMVREAKRMWSIKGQFNFTKKAREVWDEFYKGLQEYADKQSSRTQNYYSTKHTLVLKLCMCLSACYNNDRLVDSKILNLAINFFRETEHSLEDVFSGMGRNTLKPYQDKVLKFIQKSPGGVRRRKIMQEFTSDLQLPEIDQVLQALVEADLIELVTEQAHLPPVLKAKVQSEQRQAVDLLELACRTSPDPEEKSDVLEVAQELPFDPIRERLLSVQENWKRVTASGKLPLGRLGPLPEESPGS